MSQNFPDWSVRDRLVAVLLHEIGHVLGCGHVKDTVMDENLSKRLRSASGVETLKLIEPRRKLWACFDCAQAYEGEIGWPHTDQDLTAQETFKAFTGHSSQGSIRAKLEANSGIWDSVLRLSDDRGSDQIAIHFKMASQRAVLGGENPIFKAFMLNQGKPASFSLRSNGMVVYGTAVGPSGKVFPVVLEGNATIAALTQTAGPIVIRYFGADGESHLLFGARSEIQ